ncbi:MAG: glycosyltransferase family 4 protein [Solirubrobacteraceae bacterium]
MPTAPRPDRPLAILQVTPAYAPWIGGAQTCVREVSRGVQAAGAQVQVLTADPSRRLPRRERLDGIEVVRVPAWPRDGDQRFAPGVAPAIARLGGDVIHIHCYQTLVSPVAMMATARLRLPYVLTFHGGGHSTPWRNRIRTPQLKVLRPLLARAAALIATGEWEIEHYSALLGLPVAQFRLIPNGGDLPAPRDPPAAREGTLIVSVGRAERYKGHHRVLAAFPHVLREIDDAKLWIAGDGPYEAELRRIARDLGVSHRVEICALRDREAYADRLASASLATLLSDHETNPVAALEAIALGIPTLVADNSGMVELAARGQARTASLSDDSRAHARQIVELIRDPPPPVPAAPIWSWRDCAMTTLALYHDVQRRPRRA